MRQSPADQPPSSAERDAHRLRNGLVWTSALLLLLLGVGLAVPDLRDVLNRATRAAPGWLVLGIGLELASCLGYVATLRLVLHRGPRRDVRRLAWAEMAFGAVVPVGGAGGLAVGAWAMRAWGISWSRIANRSAVVFMLTSAVNASVLLFAGLGLTIGLGRGSTPIAYGIAPAVFVIVGLTFFLLLPRLASGSDARRRGRIVRRAAEWVADTETVAFTPNWRLVGTVGYLLFDIAVLWVCLRAVGAHPSVLAVVLGYQIGYLANLVPIPGGVGALEGGLLGALLLYGLPAAPTAAAVVLYHAIALWIPTVGGTIGFARLRGSVAERAGRLSLAPASAIAPAPASAPAVSAAGGSDAAAVRQGSELAA